MSSLPMPATTFVAPREWRLVVAFIALNLVLLGFGGDLWIADRIYALEGHAWRLQDGFITQAVLHVGGRRFSALAWLLVRSLSGPAWQAALLVGLAFAGLMAPALLFPNPAMPWPVRWVHMVEIGVSNFLFGLIAAFVLRLGARQESGSPEAEALPA